MRLNRISQDFSNYTRESQANCSSWSPGQGPSLSWSARAAPGAKQARFAGWDFQGNSTKLVCNTETPEPVQQRRVRRQRGIARELEVSMVSLEVQRKERILPPLSPACSVGTPSCGAPHGGPCNKDLGSAEPHWACVCLEGWVELREAAQRPRAFEPYSQVKF